jgi:hypothetical protein
MSPSSRTELIFFAFMAGLLIGSVAIIISDSFQ